ncbi:MAG: septum formation initiator family protein [Caldisericaceae bacterium]
MMKKKINIIKVVIATLIFYFSVESFINTVYLIKTYQRYLNSIEKLKELKEEKSDLQKRIAYVQSDEFIEKYARENLGLAKQNETVVYFKTDDFISPNEKQQTISENFLQKLLKLFKK